MKTVLIVSIAIIAVGAALLGYGHYGYATTESILQTGPATAPAEQAHALILAAILGWLLTGGGLCAFVLAALTKKRAQKEEARNGIAVAGPR